MICISSTGRTEVSQVLLRSESCRSCFARAPSRSSQYLATVCFASLDTFEVVAPPGPLTLSRSLHQNILGNLRGHRTAETSATPEVLKNLVRFELSRTSDTAGASDTFEVLTLPDPQTVSRSLHRKILKNFRVPWRAGTSYTFEVLANLAQFGTCAVKKKKKTCLSQKLSRHLLSQRKIWLNRRYVLRYGTSSTKSNTKHLFVSQYMPMLRTLAHDRQTHQYAHKKHLSL